MKKHPDQANPTQYVAFIGDTVASRDLQPFRRAELQTQLHSLLRRFNMRFRENLTGKAVIVTGDEFETLIRASIAPTAIPEMIWAFYEEIPDVSFRFGIGLGDLHTAISRDPRNMDGPAFHNARLAIETAAKSHLMGGVFVGFGESYDLILNGLARILHQQRSTWTRQQRNVALILHRSFSQTEAAARLGLSRQAISAYARNAGWASYMEGEEAWRQAIRLATASPATKP